MELQRIPIIRKRVANIINTELSTIQMQSRRKSVRKNAKSGSKIKTTTQKRVTIVSSKPRRVQQRFKRQAGARIRAAKKGNAKALRMNLNSVTASLANHDTKLTY